MRNLMTTPAAKTAEGTTKELLMKVSTSGTRLRADDRRASKIGQGYMHIEWIAL